MLIRKQNHKLITVGFEALLNLQSNDVTISKQMIQLILTIIFTPEQYQRFSIRVKNQFPNARRTFRSLD